MPGFYRRMRYERLAYMKENLYFKICKFCLLIDLKIKSI